MHGSGKTRGACAAGPLESTSSGAFHRSPDGSGMGPLAAAGGDASAGEGSASATSAAGGEASAGEGSAAGPLESTSSGAFHRSHEGSGMVPWAAAGGDASAGEGSASATSAARWRCSSACCVSRRSSACCFSLRNLPPARQLHGASGRAGSATCASCTGRLKDNACGPNHSQLLGSLSTPGSHEPLRLMHPQLIRSLRPKEATGLGPLRRVAAERRAIATSRAAPGSPRRPQELS